MKRWDKGTTHMDDGKSTSRGNIIIGAAVFKDVVHHKQVQTYMYVEKRGIATTC